MPKETVEEALKRQRTEFARAGGLARAKALTPKRRKEISVNAQKAYRRKLSKAKREQEMQA